MKRALTVWKGGFNSVKTRSNAESNSRNNESSFKDDPWGTVANKYYLHLVGYDDEKWVEIILDSAKYLNGKKNKIQSSGGQGSGSTNVDGIVDGDDDSESYEYRITRSLYRWDTPWEISQHPSRILP